MDLFSSPQNWAMQASKATMISVNLFAKNQPHICLRCLARFVASKFPKCPFHNNLCLWMWTRAVDEISFPGKQENQLFLNRKFDQNEEQSKKSIINQSQKLKNLCLNCKCICLIGFVTCWLQCAFSFVDIVEDGGSGSTVCKFYCTRIHSN